MLSKFKRLSVNQFTLLITLFYVCVFNIPLFEIVKQGMENQGEVNPGFIVSFPLFLICALGIIFSLFSVKFVLKPFFILLTLLSSSVFFAALKYGVVFDTGMIENTLQTNKAEAFTYLNWASTVNFILTGLLPAYLIYRLDIEYKPMWKELGHKLGFMAILLTIIGGIAFFFFQNFVAFGRNNDEIKRYVIPTYFVGSAAKYINTHYLQQPLVYKQLGLDAKNTSVNANGKPNLLVLVVGETARAMNYQYYGYDRPTNAYTQDLGLISFADVASCGTATAVSLPCMFSQMTREQYEPRRARAQDSVLDVLSHAKLTVNWLDNDSGCKGVCDRVNFVQIDLNSDPKQCSGDYCFDQVLLDKLDDELAQDSQEDRVIVLHVIGSHGPTYYLRYPDDHRYFEPDCQRSDIQNCTNEQLVNTYDNTLRYTDYILSQVVKKLAAQQSRFDTGMLYVSDHGESLGEKGMYLHGAPYAIAPKEQTQVPMLAWLSPDFASDNSLSLSCVAEHARQGSFSHDNLFSSLLGLMNVQTQAYDAGLDMFAACRS
ncbi:phosphoethanolamine--lipid A transferase [Shewanella sp. AS16]|uniref:phosphoethanolamine transferase n=1 Tax=Shewanella sp. AS16 TaxID=2907625 RepID=UPI001F47EC86|nr:phosphoethanolamine--lipid A transferase [Shewanella sp. AS16]MCE9687267.1 phosphoethanolamine--lipid A transferase [Shewanella sp. AS16]